MTYLIRNYKFGRKRIINLGDLGVVIFEVDQQVAITSNSRVAKALATEPKINVVRRMSGRNSSIPRLVIVNGGAYNQFEVEDVPVALVDGPLVAIEPEVKDEFIEDGLELCCDTGEESGIPLLPLCACGCGKPVTHAGNRFLRGHHFRGRKKENK